MGVQVEIQRVGMISGGVLGPGGLGPVVIGFYFPDATGWQLVDVATGTYNLVTPRLPADIKADRENAPIAERDTVDTHEVTGTIVGAQFIWTTDRPNGKREVVPVDELLTRP